jgi:8-amino-7-oxononanoate synthase
VFTTAIPPAIAAASRVSLKLVQSESWRRDKLQNLISRFRFAAREQGLQLMDSMTAIQPILVGDSQKAIAASEALLMLGFWVSAIRPPTVPSGTARLRVTFSANHENHHVDALLDALAKVQL